MANLIRSSKPGNEWTRNDLEAYNITIIEKYEEDFFIELIKNVPLGTEEIISKEEPDNNMNNISYTLLKYLDLAMRQREAEESAVDDFGIELFKVIGYSTRNRIVRSRKSIKLFICGEDTYTKTDICLIGEDDILLLVQEDKSVINRKDPEPQVIAEAIAAFQENNLIRNRVKLLPELEELEIPAITMVGTFPGFYRINITKELDDCVRKGMYPQNVTRVYRYTPRIPRRQSDGMKPLDNRVKILQCFEGFKKFIDRIEHILKI